MSRSPLVAALAVGITLALSACAAEPEPEPTPTGFTTEAEAFKAAEQTYRAYVEALNGADLQNPSTLEPVYNWLANGALEATREEFTTMSASGWTKTGTTVASFVEPVPGSFRGSALSLNACLDVSDVEVLNTDGTSVVSADRSDVQALLVDFTWSTETRTHLQISGVTGREGEPSCD
ncbi:hypothetical protein [Microbacterium sp. Marseille-Q6965]|uniref:hypothetical protein n=1 Tax=Microbacterium sp. Marseille-Q6965 TaxID=2965072 RepID=UPI0021B6FF3E|nr:hypothetical protein [Microbacterium sp. Marseille-Q6965]